MHQRSHQDEQNQNNDFDGLFFSSHDKIDCRGVAAGVYEMNFLNSFNLKSDENGCIRVWCGDRFTCVLGREYYSKFRSSPCTDLSTTFNHSRHSNEKIWYFHK